MPVVPAGTPSPRSSTLARPFVLSNGLSWQPATVIEVVDETPDVKSIVLAPYAWQGHRSGQHVDARVTVGNDGHAHRSYWIASAPEDGFVVLTVERHIGGTVSPRLFDDLSAGDTVEIRGPIGNRFIWDDSQRQPVLCIADGTGIAPFRSMLRHSIAVESTVPIRVVYSSRSLADVIYSDELLRMAAYDEVEIRLTLTDHRGDGWRGRRGRVDRQLLEDVAWPVEDQPLSYVCGPDGFVDAAADALHAIGYRRDRIRSERLDPGR